jgi:predicted glutamine amidotransferase/predicted TPR repeat methyltransferase
MGMNCATPTDFNFSFRGFKCRGGNTDIHSHGWGLAMYEGRGVRTFHDTLPCASSPLANMVASYPIKTLNMMAHIRYATQGAVTLENVHPFQRELWGIIWTFAHNGDVPNFGVAIPLPSEIDESVDDWSIRRPSIPQLRMLGHCRTEAIYNPVGDTDSEAVFCAILNALKAEFKTLPTLPVLYEAIQKLCCEIVRGNENTTILNFLLGCGQFTMFAFSWPGSREGSAVWNGLHYLVRSPPFKMAKLKDEDYAVNFNETNGENDRVAIIATKPLTTNEEWKEFRRGQLLMFDTGLPYSRPFECAGIERCGRGLSSRSIPQSEICPYQYQYNIPRLLRKSVCAVLGKEECGNCLVTWAAKAVDLGCGSGLSGAMFRQCVEHLTGVDHSAEMAKEAQNRGCYDRIMVGDAECILQKYDDEDNTAGPTLDYNFVFACDLFAYIGDLQKIFLTARKCLECQGGIFAFSAEVVDESVNELYNEEDSGYVMQSCARYAHKRWYIRSLAEKFGFETLSCKESTVLRKYDEKDVLGALIVLSLPPSKRFSLCGLSEQMKDKHVL